MEKLLEEETLTDFNIICGLDLFPCHKSILANQSDVFAAVMNSNSWEENKSNKYPIEGHNPKVVKQMINFFAQTGFQKVLCVTLNSFSLLTSSTWKALLIYVKPD